MTETNNRPTFFKQLIHRRVFQITGIYLGAILALTEFAGILVERYALVDYIIDLVIAGMASMIPSVCLLAWRFGAPGKDEWSAVEKYAIPSNALVAVAFLIFIVPKSVSLETTHTISAMDESGTQIKREVPKQEYIKRIQIFFFSPDNLAPADQWLSYATSYLMSTYLQQDSFLDISDLYQGYADGSIWKIKRAGFVNGLDIPNALAQSIARDSDIQYFTRGSINIKNDKYAINLDLMETATGKEITTIYHSHADLFSLVTTVSNEIKKHVSVPSNELRSINNIPIKDITTSNLEALRVYIEGKNALLFNNDHETAFNKMSKATEIEPSFALAYLDLAKIKVEQGKYSDADQLLKKTLQQSYKLPERVRFLAKSYSYAVKNEIDKQLAIYKMWMELYPNDVFPKNFMANQLIWKGNKIEESIKLYEESLSISPNQYWILDNLGNLYIVANQLEKAKQAFEKSIQERPSSYTPLVRLGFIEQINGNLEGARKYYERAAFIRTDMVSPILMLADLDLRVGNIDDAKSRFKEALSISEAPKQLSTVYEQLLNFHRRLGQPKKAFEYLQQLSVSLEKFEDPLNRLFRSQLTLMSLYVAASETERGFNDLAIAEGQLQPPLDTLVSYGYIGLYLALEDTENAEHHFAIIQKSMHEMKLAHLYYLEHMFNGFIKEQKQDYSKAAEEFEKSIKLHRFSMQFLNDNQSSSYFNSALIRNLRKQKVYDRAISLGEGFLKEWPMHPEINFELAQSHFEKGDLEQSMKHLEKALLIWKDAEEDFDLFIDANHLLKKLNEK